MSIVQGCSGGCHVSVYNSEFHSSKQPVGNHACVFSAINKILLIKPDWISSESICVYHYQAHIKVLAAQL